MEPLISVIVPVYNVEEYLNKCVDSIINQTYKNIEILLIDDGSTDTSGAICDDYSQRYDNVKTYHKKNGGLSSARNFGIERASGEYLGFVDSDDYIHKEMYERLYSLIKEYDADLSECLLTNVYNGKNLINNEKERVLVVNSETAIDLALKAEIANVVAVDKLYRRSLFDNVRYPVGKTIEDGFVIVDILSQCDRIVITTEQMYYYVHRKGSITTDAFSTKSLDAIEAYEKNYNIIKNKYPAILDSAILRLCWAHFYVLDKIIYDNSEEHKETKKNVIRFLRKNCGFILRNQQFTKGRKLATAMLMISPKLYKMCVILQNRRRFQH